MLLTLRDDLLFVTATLSYRGAGGREHVFVRSVDRFAIGEHGVNGFEVEVGEMDYGFDIGGILGLDFLRATGAVIDLGRLTIELG
jgi:hypothetical protein